jgi:hypothetical protein
MPENLQPKKLSKEPVFELFRTPFVHQRGKIAACFGMLPERGFSLFAGLSQHRETT